LDKTTEAKLICYPPLVCGQVAWLDWRFSIQTGDSLICDPKTKYKKQWHEGKLWEPKTELTCDLFGTLRLENCSAMAKSGKKTDKKYFENRWRVGEGVCEDLDEFLRCLLDLPKIIVFSRQTIQNFMTLTSSLVF